MIAASLTLRPAGRHRLKIELFDGSCRMVGIVLISTTFLFAAPAPKDKSAEYQKKADAATWEWPDEQAKLEFSIKRCKLKVETSVGDQGETSITVKSGDGPVIKFDGHASTSFVVEGQAVYFADFSPVATGCMIVAMDLKTGKQLWKRRLKGLGR